MPDRISIRSRRFQFEWLLLALALIGSGGFVAISLYEHYRHDDADERTRLQAQAKVIDDNIVHHVAGADRALATIIGDIAYWRGDGQASPRLKAFGEIIGGVRTLLIVDAAGRVVASSRDAMLGMDISRLDHFRTPQRNPTRGLLYVSPPYQSAAGDWVIHISRAVIGAGGRFAGVVVAELDPQFFRVLLQSVLYAPDMTSSIMQGDGRLYLALPDGSATANHDLGDAASLFARHRASGDVVSVLTGSDGSGGTQRMATFITLRPPGVAADKSLVVAVSRDLKAIHSPWRREARELLGLFGVFLLASVFGLRFHQRRQRRLDVLEAEHAADRREAADRLRLATEAVHVGIWEHRLTDDRVVWDTSMFMIYGVEPATFSPGMATWRDSVLAVDRATFAAVLQPADRSGQPFSGSFRIRRGDGAIRMIRALAQTRCADDGSALKVIGINEDITEQWQADQAVRESEARFRLLADSAPVLIWMADAALSRGYFNRPWLVFTGRSPDAEAGTGWLDNVHPEDCERLRMTCGSAYIEGRDYSIEYRLRRDDGVWRWMLEHGVRRLGGDGAVIGYVGSCVDIDGRRHAEAELRKLSRAVEQSAAAVVITDASGRIEYVSPATCAIYGYSEEELLDRDPRIFSSGSTSAEVYRSMWETILAGRAWCGELTNRRRDGTLIEERMSVSPVRDDAGAITHFVALKSDLSAEREAQALRRDLESRLARVERMELLSSLAGGIAHDFNNILVAILGFSGMGRSAARTGGSPRIAGYFEEIEMAGERARALVQQLRAFSRGGQMVVEPVDVEALVEEVIKLLDVTFPARIRLSAEIDDELPLLSGDPSHLHQLLMNLCVNARDAMSSPGSVVVSARPVQIDRSLICASCHREFAGEFFRIAVRDDGPGIPDAIRERIFEPFFTTKEIGQASGMGLAVVHGIAHLYEGHVQLSSEVGRGTEVAIYLPRRIPGMDAQVEDLQPVSRSSFA